MSYHYLFAHHQSYYFQHISVMSWGYMRTDLGVGDYRSRPCSPGYFYPATKTLLQPCSAGTWSVISNSASRASCPAGFMCGAKAITSQPCPRGQYCPAGTAVVAQPCPSKVYCEVAVPDPLLCPGGYFCPAGNTNAPIRCQLGYCCPSGSAAPSKCPSGTVYTKYSLRLNPAEACVSCGPGLYSFEDVLKCSNCWAGYACPNGASRPDPQTLEQDGGYPCQLVSTALSRRYLQPELAGL